MPDPDLPQQGVPPEQAAAGGGADAAQALARGRALADSVERLLLPVPLLTPGEESALRSASNDQQLARARALGVRVTDRATLDRLIAEGRLIRLEDSTSHWVMRELRSSAPYVTPDARALLVQMGERFQARLARMGLPPFRLEVTSVLRTPEDQAALRQTNPNAAAGVSTHEYGTTLDVAYTGYAAPAASDESDPVSAAIVALALERMTARYSRELQKVLGDVLREMQSEGLVMVTLERQQPVYHFTVARALAGGS